MSSKTKIFVFRAKDLISTGIFVLLAILLIILLAAVFAPKKSDTKTPESAAAAKETGVYIPGIYTTSLLLGDSAIDIEVVVDADNINSIRLVNISEAVATMYPLIEPVFESLAAQIYEKQTIDGVTYEDESKYTNIVLLEAIGASLDKAKE